MIALFVGFRIDSEALDASVCKESKALDDDADKDYEALDELISIDCEDNDDDECKWYEGDNAWLWNEMMVMQWTMYVLVYAQILNLMILELYCYMEIVFHQNEHS